MPFDRNTILDSPTGAALRLRIRTPARPPLGVIHIIHGFAEHSVRYERFADALASAGFVIYAHDQRGHGETTAPGAPRGRFAERLGVERLLDDIDAIHALIASERAGLPLILFGHSMGGLVALNSVFRRSNHLAGAALWNANFSAGSAGRLAQASLAWERFRLGSDATARLVPRLTFAAWGRQMLNARTPSDWLSSISAEVDRYLSDPHCGWDGTVSMWQDVFHMIFAGADDRRLASVRRDLPFNLAGGADDPSTHNGRAVEKFAERLRRAGFSNLKSKVWPETRHEGLNDVKRDEITKDFIGWATEICRTVAAKQDAAASK